MKALIGILITFSCFLFTPWLTAQQITFDDSDPEIMILSNGTSYELALFKSNGSLAHIRDILSNEELVKGSANTGLWGISFSDNSVIWASEFTENGDKIMSYQWDDTYKVLSLTYLQSGSSAVVDIKITTENYFDMQLSINNKWGKPTMGIVFPGRLSLSLGDENSVILPHAFPGMMLFPEFFKNSEHFIYTYPDVYHADYASINYEKSNLSLYSINHEKKLISVELGIRPYDNIVDDINYYFKHKYIKWLQPDSVWQSPVSRCWIGTSPIESAKAYRTDNKIDSYPSLEEKLGEQFDSIANSPLIYYHYHIFDQPLPFKDLPGLIDLYPSPALLSINSYFPGDCHGNYPDYLPPDSRFGTAEDLKYAISEIQSQGKKVLLLTLPVWWNDKSIFVQNMDEAQINDAGVIRMDGTVHRHSYVDAEGAPDEEWDYGWFVSPHSPLVKQKLNEMFDIVFNQYGADIIYQDVLGATYDNLDFNVNSPSPDDFKQEWHNHVIEYSEHLSMAEFAYDKMAEYIFASKGGNMFGTAPLQHHADHLPGKILWQPYPTAPFIYGDKMATYAWNPFSFGIHLESLSYNLIFGCPLVRYTRTEIAWEETNNDDVSQLYDFQKHVGSRTYGRQMLDYTGTPGKVTTADYGDLTLTTNWDNEESYAVDNHTIPPHGIYIKSDDDSLVAGTFTRFNGEELEITHQNNPEELCQRIVRELVENKIIIKHSKGVGTPIKIIRPLLWTDENKIDVYKCTSSGNRLVPYTLDQQSINFNLEEFTFQDTLSWYEITYGVPVGTVSDREIHGRIQVYPNPVESLLFIKAEIAQPVPYSLCDLYGREISSGHIFSEEDTINVSVVPAGIYFLRISQQCFKIVISD